VLPVPGACRGLCNGLKHQIELSTQKALDKSQKPGLSITISMLGEYYENIHYLSGFICGNNSVSWM